MAWLLKRDGMALQPEQRRGAKTVFREVDPRVDPAHAPLTQEQLVALGEARLRFGRILRAAHAAHRAFVGLLLSGVITTLLAVWGGFHFWAFVMGAWMIVAGIIEYVGAERIRRLRKNALRILRMNQLLLGIMFILIGCWWMLEVKLGRQDASLRRMVGSLSGADMGISTARFMQLAHLCLYVAYGSIAAFGLIAQGGMFLYYTWRDQQLQAYLAETPEWIIGLESR